MIQLIELSKDQATSKDLKYPSMRSPWNCNKVKRFCLSVGAQPTDWAGV